MLAHDSVRQAAAELMGDPNYDGEMVSDLMAMGFPAHLVQEYTESQSPGLATRMWDSIAHNLFTLPGNRQEDADSRSRKYRQADLLRKKSGVRVQPSFQNGIGVTLPDMDNSFATGRKF
ncbi:hypothetical protein [Rosistilla ulvae]|nr:hypothetical protein [Rosistilla ulvae]